MTIKQQKIFLFVTIVTGVVVASLALESLPANRLGWAVLLCGTVFSALGSIRLGILFQNEPRQKDKGDPSSLLPAYGVIVLSLITQLEYLYIAPVLPRNAVVQYIGLTLFFGGMCVSLLPYIYSRKESSPRAAVGRQSGRFLARPILWLGRPFFAGILLSSLGLSIGFSSLLGISIVFLLILPGLVYRMMVEDREFFRKSTSNVN